MKDHVDQPAGQDGVHQGGSRARYEKVVDVVDNLRAAGVDKLGLLTEQVQQDNTARRTPPPTASGRDSRVTNETVRRGF